MTCFLWFAVISKPLKLKISDWTWWKDLSKSFLTIVYLLYLRLTLYFLIATKDGGHFYWRYGYLLFEFTNFPSQKLFVWFLWNYINKNYATWWHSFKGEFITGYDDVFKYFLPKHLPNQSKWLLTLRLIESKRYGKDGILNPAYENLYT